MVIWIDGDACPREVTELVYSAAIRTKTSLNYIANSYRKIPGNSLFRFVLVSRSPDAADDYIVENLKAEDIVITSDIPFAYEALQKKAYVMNSKGETFTENNIRDRLSTRDLMHDLRSSGLITGGPKAYSPRDKMNFANALDRALAKKK